MGAGESARARTSDGEGGAGNTGQELEAGEVSKEAGMGEGQMKLTGSCGFSVGTPGRAGLACLVIPRSHLGNICWCHPWSCTLRQPYWGEFMGVASLTFLGDTISQQSP